jgi:hypothetical protein
MQDWWEALSTFEKVFWYISIPFSLILLIQMILTFAGMGGGSSDIGEAGPDMSGLDTDVEIDTEVADDHSFGTDYPQFDVFTVRNFIAFFAVFGWAGIAGISQDFSTFWTIFFATGMGLVTVIIISALFYFISRFADSGTLDIRNALGQIGNVYIPIKASGGNIGKISVNIQDSIREMRAITKATIDLPTGTVVKVTGIVSGDILVVEKFTE